MSKQCEDITPYIPNSCCGELPIDKSIYTVNENKLYKDNIFIGEIESIKNNVIILKKNK